ncbi:MAG: DUF92 domain-containing protein [Euryarchaeota archaeon]|nr:DUF92 domain-containing protein [Euryarchaeota archaeon]
MGYIAAIALCAVMAGLAYWRGLLSGAGSAAALAVGILIAVFGGLGWVLILLIFLLSSFAATRYRFEAKKAMGLEEGARGERGPANVLANGAVACAAAVAYFFFRQLDATLGNMAVVLFLVAVATAASDTLASELGVLSPKAYLITNGKRVPPGTNGGVSGMGTVWALVAAAYVSAVGNIVLLLTGAIQPTAMSVFLPILFGFVGCQVDSVFGALLENRGLISKQTNNLYSIALATLMAAVVMLCLR